MISAELLPDDDVAYLVSFRQARPVPSEGVARGRFETTSRQQLLRAARYGRRSAGQARSGIHRRGKGKMLEFRL